jgi:hypothetical protein
MSTIHQNIFFSLVFHAYEYLGIPFSTITPKSLTITSTSQFSFCISINSFFFHNDILTQLNYLIPHPYIISPFLPPIYVMIFITFYIDNLYINIFTTIHIFKNKVLTFIKLCKSFPFTFCSLKPRFHV